jgi:hypothetical protein
MANNGRETPKNQPIPKKTPNAPPRPRRTQTPNRNSNAVTPFETPPRPLRLTPPRIAARPTARRLNFNNANANFRRFLNELFRNTPMPSPKTPAQQTPKRTKKK